MDSFNYADTLTSDDFSCYLDAQGELSTIAIAGTPNDCYDRDVYEMYCQPRTVWREIGAVLSAFLKESDAIGREVNSDVNEIAAEARADAVKRAKAVVEKCTQLPPDQVTPVSSPIFSGDGRVEKSLKKQQSEQIA